MVWSWSHTPEAYADAERNLQAAPVTWLVEAASEWEATEWSESGFAEFDLDKSTAALRKFKDWRPGALADFIWQQMSSEEYGMRCDNGGHNAWACPYGCHTVPFSPPSEVNETKEGADNAT